MLLIPAMVLKGGRCEGAGVAPGTGPAPAEALRIAAPWAAAGVRRLQVADSEAGQPGKLQGLEVLRALAAAHPEVQIQVAGNFRDGDAVGRYLGAGADYAILDAKAAATAHFVNDLCLEYPGHILMSLEARAAGKAAAGGWSKMARQPLNDAARRFQQEGVAGVIYRATGGADDSPDITPAIELAEILTIPVLIGVALKSHAALARLCAAAQGLTGAVLEAGYRGEPQTFTATVQLAASVPVAE